MPHDHDDAICNAPSNREEFLTWLANHLEQLTGSGHPDLIEPRDVRVLGDGEISISFPCTRAVFRISLP